MFRGKSSDKLVFNLLEGFFITFLIEHVDTIKMVINWSLKVLVKEEGLRLLLISYEEENGEYPKSIIIHRDVFSREDIEWYIEYFSKKNIKFNI